MHQGALAFKKKLKVLQLCYRLPNYSVYFYYYWFAINTDCIFVTEFLCFPRLKKACVGFEHMFEEVPIVIKNSHLINVLMWELQEKSTVADKHELLNLSSRSESPRPLCEFWGKHLSFADSSGQFVSFKPLCHGSVLLRKLTEKMQYMLTCPDGHSLISTLEIGLACCVPWPEVVQNQPSGSRKMLQMQSSDFIPAFLMLLDKYKHKHASFKSSISSPIII